MHVYLDLDRTLFQTAKAKLLWEEIARLHPEIALSTVLAERENYYVWHDDLYAYDFGAQVQACGLDSEAVFAELCESDMADGRLEFPGVEDVIEVIQASGVDFSILTYGTADYQQLKLDLCPHLAGVEMITVLEPKAIYLEDKPTCLLVDDKDLTSELPLHVRFIQVELEGREGEYPGVVRSLPELAEVLTRELG